MAFAAAALVVLLAATMALVVWRDTVVDTDADGLTDRVEAAGWTTADGSIHVTDPQKADSDGDGLTDLDEAGALAADGRYAGYSDPLRADTDADGLGDAGEADTGLDPRNRDVDGDGALDGYEVDVLGTDPQVPDTDGDGLSDGYEDDHRDSQGLDPLAYDEQVSGLSYAADFAQGFLAGDFAEKETLAWLAGNIAAGSSSSLPGLGTLVGGAADVRDAVASAIHGDWVGSAWVAAGAVPGGDAVSVPRKVEVFLARHPKLVVAAAQLVARTGLPEAIKRAVARRIWPDWDVLLQSGASETWLVRLQQGRTDLRDLAAALRRHAGVAGPASAPVRSGRMGELALERRYAATTTGVDRQVRLSTAGCGTVCGGSVRVVDVLKDGVAHESKVGRVGFSAFTQRQIRKDAFLVATGQITKAVWHFTTSEYTNTVGADPRVLDLLDHVGIGYEIQPPADS